MLLKSMSTCRSLSQATQSAGQLFISILTKMLNCLSTNFVSSQFHGCYIRIFFVLIEEFGSREEHEHLFDNIFENFSKSTLIMALTSLYICDQESDLVEAFANFASVFTCNPPKEVLVILGSILELSFQMAAICCTAIYLDRELTAMSSISCFLENGLNALLGNVQFK